MQARPEQERPREGTTLITFPNRFITPTFERLRKKEAMTEVLKAHQNLLVKVREEKRTYHHVQTSRKEVAKGEIQRIIGMFPNVQNSNLQVDERFEDK